MLNLKNARSAHDDFLSQLCDVERQWLVGQSSTWARDLLLNPRPIDVHDVANGMRANGEKTVGAQLDISPRTDDCCLHFASAEFSAASPDQLERLEGDFLDEFVQRVANYDSGASARDASEVAAWAHTQILSIRPLSQANLALAEAWVILTAHMFGHIDRPLVPLESDEAAAWVADTEVRDGYDKAIRDAHESGNLEALTDFIEDRLVAWRRRGDGE